jgi:hypothetical protein
VSWLSIQVSDFDNAVSVFASLLRMRSKMQTSPGTNVCYVYRLYMNTNV